MGAPDALSRLELDMLVEGAVALRARLDAGDIPAGDDLPLALEPERCAAMAGHLQGQREDGHAVTVRRVYAAFEPDERGLLEVLFTTTNGPAYVNGKAQPPQARTAFMRGVELVYVVEGW